MIFYTIGAFFTIIFQCRPMAMQWDMSVEGSCWSPVTLQALAYTSIALNMLTDILFALVIPLPMLWGLNLNRRTKAALRFVLSLGVFACAAAAVRVSYIARYGIRTNYLWDTRQITIWYVIEASVGIIAGSLPALKPLLKRIIGSTRRYATGKTTNYRSSGMKWEGSGSMWKSKGSRHQISTTDLDDNDSERGLNAARSNAVHGYPMDEYPKAGNTFFATVERDDGVESEGDVSAPDAAARGEGITKTTTTTLSFLTR